MKSKGNHIAVVSEFVDAQQAIMGRRLVFGRDTQPFEVRVKLRSGHRLDDSSGK